ncbi:MAG: YfhL family 4Fe-4S dicluster ferredoxin [Myxococcales bacterium]|nr:YfhL family 4Fe-4S dicluster ferredoxin [Myxococcales bacterium]
MAMTINDSCINCGACEPECPNKAISEGSGAYQVDPEHCTECVGAHDQPKCVEVCPVDDCVVVNAARPETKEQLQARYERLRAAG